MKFKIKIKTAEGTQVLLGVFANVKQAWDRAFDMAGTPDAAITVRVLP